MHRGGRRRLTAGRQAPADAAGATSIASRPTGPGETTKVTGVPSAMEREPSAIRVQWNDQVVPELPATTHLSIVDGQGNAVALTSSIEAGFGSRIQVDGFLLNK